MSYTFLLNSNIKVFNLKKLFILIFLLKIVAIFIPSPFTTDHHRYVWEGKLIRNNISPYKIPPNSEKLLFLSDDNHKLVNNNSLTAIYPVVSEALFSAFAYNIYTWKTFIFIIDLLSIFLLLKILSVENKNLLIFYILNPLIFIEGSLSAHLDFLLIPLILIFIISKNDIIKLLSVIIASFIKYNAVIFFVPLSLFYLLNKKFRELFLIFKAFFIIFSILVVQFLYFREMFDSLLVYLDKWSFNSLVYTFLSSYNFENLRLILLLLMFVCIFISTVFLKKERLVIVSSVFFYCFFTPTFHPWYFLPIVPLLVIDNSKYLLAFSSSILISYSFYIYNLKELSIYIILSEYLLILIFFLFNRFLFRKP